MANRDGHKQTNHTNYHLFGKKLDLARDRHRLRLKMTRVRISPLLLGSRKTRLSRSLQSRLRIVELSLHGFPGCISHRHSLTAQAGSSSLWIRRQRWTRPRRNIMQYPHQQASSSISVEACRQPTIYSLAQFTVALQARWARQLWQIRRLEMAVKVSQTLLRWTP